MPFLQNEYIFIDSRINEYSRLLFAIVVVVHENTLSCAAGASLPNYNRVECQIGYRLGSSMVECWRAMPWFESRLGHFFTPYNS